MHLYYLKAMYSVGHFHQSSLSPFTLLQAYKEENKKEKKIIWYLIRKTNSKVNCTEV